jgi:hypothetical protein
LWIASLIIDCCPCSFKVGGEHGCHVLGQADRRRGVVMG